MEEIKKILIEINQKLDVIVDNLQWKQDKKFRIIKECHLSMGLSASGKTTFGKTFNEDYFDFDPVKINARMLLDKITYSRNKCYIDTYISNNNILNYTLNVLNDTFSINKFIIHYWKNNYLARKENGIRRGFRQVGRDEYLEDIKVNCDINFEVIYHEVYQENGRNIENSKRE